MKRNQLIPLKTFSNLVITTPNPLPAGTQGSLYSVTFTAAGGQQWGSGPAYHYSWFLLHDYSSTGLVMNQSTGVLSGSPSTSGLCQFVVAVTDNLGSSVQQSYTATFAPAVGLTITTSSLPNASVGSAYSFTMSAVNGTPPYTWSITSDTPDTGGWLSISSSGVLSGTPSTAETETVVIKVQDTLANTASKTFTLLVNSTSLQITTTSPLPNATPSSPYFTGISAIAGAPPYTWSLQTGYVAPTEVQSSGLISATAATASGTLNGVTAGNSILAIITYLSSPPNFHQPSGVSDGNAYTLDSFNIGIAHQSVNVYRLSNVTAGTHTVVGTKNAGDTSATWNMVLIEVVGNISPDQTVNNSGNSTGPVSPGTTATLTNANEFAVSLALVNVADTGLTVPAPWTQVGLTSNTALAYRTTSTTSGIGVNFGTLGTANEWCTVLQTYQGSGTSYPYSINSSTGVLSWNSPVLGNYTVPVQVVDTAPTTVNKTFSLTVSNATGKIKWQPGHYGNIFSQIHRYTNNTGTGYYTMPVIQPYIGTGANTGIQFSGVAGLSMTCYWGYLETSTPGNYNFGGNTSITGQLPDIDQILAQCATLGKYFWLMVNLGGPAWGNSGSSAGNYIPPYILSGAAYGAADVGSSGQSGTGIFGVAAAYGGGNVANFANDNVMTAVQNLIAALAAAYDSNPYFVGIRFLAWDAIAPYAGTSMAASGDEIFYASLQTIYLYAKSVFTHTNVCFQGGFGNLTAANLTQTLVQDGILCGSSDISGASAWAGTYMALSEVFTGNGVWASAPTGTSGTLSAGQTFDGYTGTALTGSMSCPMTFSGGPTVTATFTKGSGTVTWTPSVSAQSTSGTTVSFNPLWATQSTQTYLNYSGVMNNSWPALAKPLYQVLPGAWDIEPEDMKGGAGAPYPTIFLAPDLCSALNNDLHGAYAFWWMMLNGAGNNGGISTAIWESAVVPAIQAAPLVSTGYPYGVFNPMLINFAALAGDGGTTYVEGFPVFRNRVREGMGFTIQGASYPAGTVALQASGWPAGDFECTLWVGDAQQTWSTGVWQCGFIGTGSETLSVPGYAQNTIVGGSYHPGTGGSYSLFQMNVNSSGVQQIGIRISGTTGGVTNFFCYLPGYPNTVIDNPTSAAAFTTEAINHYKNYSAIRYMMNSYCLSNSLTMTSSNRSTPSNTQCVYAFGNGDHWPQEWCTAISLASGVGLWLNLPNIYDATFTYATSLANALLAVVPSGTPIYLEISDEMWNGAGPGITAWNNAATAYGAVDGFAAPVPFFCSQVHGIAAAFRAVFGSRYGTDVRFVLAWQADGNGVYFRYNVFQYYALQGWTISATNGQGGDFWVNSAAPYIPSGFTSADNAFTIAQINAQLTTTGSTACFTHSMEQINVMGLKYGIPTIAYEGGFDLTAGNVSGMTNVGAAMMDPSQTPVMNNYYQTLANSGLYGIATFSGGVDGNDSLSNNLSPRDYLTNNWSALTTTGSPRYNSILNYTGGWTAQRNLVSASPTTISGGNYLDTSGGASANLGANGTAPFDAPNYGVVGQCSFLVNCSRPGTYSLSVNFTNTGSAGLTGLEYAGQFNPFTVLAPTVSIPSGTGNVTVGTVTLVSGANYVSLGKPGTKQAAITINSLTFT